MPKEDERRKELTQKEIEAEKFRTFFSTGTLNCSSVICI